MVQPARRQRRHDGARRDGREEQAGPAGARAVDADRKHGKQRARHPERHRREIDREGAQQRRAAAHERQALPDRGDDRTLRPARLRKLGRQRQHRADHRQAADARRRRRPPRRRPRRSAGRRARARAPSSAGRGRSSRRSPPACLRGRATRFGMIAERTTFCSAPKPASSAGEHVEQRDRRLARQRRGAERGRARATSPIWSSASSRRRSLRSASAPPSSAIATSGPELDGAEQAGQQRRMRLDVDLVGQRDERGLRAEPDTKLPSTSIRSSREARNALRSTVRRGSRSGGLLRGMIRTGTQRAGCGRRHGGATRHAAGRRSPSPSAT